MAKLLYIEASPRKERSHSIQVAKAFIDAYHESCPEDDVEEIDLWDCDLPELNNDTVSAKYKIMHGLPHTKAEAKAWAGITEIFEYYNSADKYLYSIPMWNFGIPYKLKHFIDIITQPGLAFKYSEASGYEGLVKGKPVAIIYARGGEYSSGPMEEYDLQKKYFELNLRFIGFTDIIDIIVEPTMAGGELKTASVQKKAIEEAVTLAEKF